MVVSRAESTALGVTRAESTALGVTRAESTVPVAMVAGSHAESTVPEATAASLASLCEAGSGTAGGVRP